MCLPLLKKPPNFQFLAIFFVKKNYPKFLENIRLLTSLPFLSLDVKQIKMKPKSKWQNRNNNRGKNFFGEWERKKIAETSVICPLRENWKKKPNFFLQIFLKNGFVPRPWHLFCSLRFCSTQKWFILFPYKWPTPPKKYPLIIENSFDYKNRTQPTFKRKQNTFRF